LAVGDGLRGRIVDIQTTGSGRSRHAVWVVEEDLERPLRVREGDKLAQAGYKKREAILLEGDTARGRRRFQLEIVKGIQPGEGPLGRVPNDPRWEGKTVTFLSLSDQWFAVIKAQNLWDRTGPGTWLTHRQPWEDWETSAGENDHDVDAEVP
jgi:hypothetical protein